MTVELAERYGVTIDNVDEHAAIIKATPIRERDSYYLNAVSTIQRMVAQQRIAEAEQAKAKAFAESHLGQFLATLSPMKAGRAQKTLERPAMYEDKLYRRHELVEYLVSLGGHARKTSRGYGLTVDEDETYIDVTKIEADYAIWLVETA